MKQHTTADGITYIERPGRLAELRSDVIVPTLQAAVIALALGLAVGVLALLWIGPGRGLGGGALWAWSGRLAATATVIALLVAIVAFVLQHRRVILSIEEWTGRDGDGDGTMGQPEPPKLTRIELVEDPQHRRYLSLPVEDAKLHQVARLCLWHGKAFSRRELANALSQGEYAKLADAMLAGGLLRETPTGRELTASGRAVLRRYA